MNRPSDIKYSYDWQVTIGRKKTMLVYVRSQREYKIGEEVVAKIDSGGGVYRAVETYLRKGKWQKPNPYWRIVFDEKLLAPRYAAAILMAHAII